jgi:ribosomal protein L11 methyltransferase
MKTRIAASSARSKIFLGKTWPALILRARSVDDSEELVSALLADFNPVAIQDLAERPLPPGGLWDPTYPPIPDPPPTPLHWNVCFSDATDRDRAADAIAATLPQLAIERVDLPDEDWAARSQQSLKAVHAGKFIVAPPWDVPPDDVDATVIVIEPSMGFGTGHHATTRMCLRLLSEIDVVDATVLDLGTGSGVLSMAAALMGARSVIGIDIDQDAIDSAEASARLNTLPDTISFVVSDFRKDPPAAADVVLANLTGGMLTSTAEQIGALVRPGGQLILSGFDHTEVDAVVRAFPGFSVKMQLAEDNWIALLLTSVNHRGH